MKVAFIIGAGFACNAKLLLAKEVSGRPAKSIFIKQSKIRRMLKDDED